LCFFCLISRYNRWLLFWSHFIQLLITEFINDSSFWFECFTFHKHYKWQWNFEVFINSTECLSLSSHLPLHSQIQTSSSYQILCKRKKAMSKKSLVKLFLCTYVCKIIYFKFKISWLKMLCLYILGQNCLHLTLEPYLSSETFSSRYEKLPNIVIHACKNITERMNLLKTCGQQIWLCLFTFRPIASKHPKALKSLTKIVTLSWLGGAEVTHPLWVQ